MTTRESRGAPCRRRVDRAGFTLVEVLVALGLGGLVILGARAMLEQLADGGERIIATARAADVESNADRLMRSLAGRLEVGTGPGTEFSGDERLTRFASWCDVPAGWQERCRVALTIDSLAGAPVLIAVFSTGEIIPLRQGFTTGSLRYLIDPTNGGVWFRSWGRGITAPLAIGIVLDGDTLILRIGERG